MQALIYTYAKDSYLHERSVAALANPYIIGALLFPSIWMSFERAEGRF